MSASLRLLALVLVASVAGCGRSALLVAAESRAGAGIAAAGGRAELNAAGSAAAVPAVCGNGRIESGEECDRTTLGASTCASLGFNGGLLRCARDCQYDTSGCVAMPQANHCPAPESPIALTRACIDQLCSCDRAALLNCNFPCWSKVACQVATCNNDPSRKECAMGCADARPAELSLGRCYENSPACARR
jgi:hypothetical protein